MGSHFPRNGSGVPLEKGLGLPWQTSGLLQYLVGELISRVPLRVAKREEKEKKRGLFISPREARDLQVPLSLPLLFPHRTHPVSPVSAH